MAAMTWAARASRDAPSVSTAASFRAALAPAHLVRRRVRSTAERVRTYDQERRSFAANGPGRNETGFDQPGRLRSWIAARDCDPGRRQLAEGELSERSVSACPADPARAQEGRLRFGGAEPHLGPCVDPRVAPADPADRRAVDLRDAANAQRRGRARPDDELRQAQG